MSGLRFTTGLDVAAGPQGRYGNRAAPTSASEAAFGPVNMPANTGASLMPTNPGSLALWAGVGGVIFLILVYRSLPG